MPLEGKEALEFTAEIGRRNAELYARQLAAAKRDAAARGKEPFDLARLETMCDTSSEGRMDPEPVRHERFEEMYYLHFPDVMTLEDFAREVDELNKW
ncbi:MAG TPA: hypothetical protein VFD36_13560 [Kofleriaceae bacterium]|jgi:hypothetical protein|nr:hypothetical protein [Kofleriaceae bacterium]